jgi:hypothetical protein
MDEVVAYLFILRSSFWFRQSARNAGDHRPHTGVIDRRDLPASIAEVDLVNKTTPASIGEPTWVNETTRLSIAGVDRRMITRHAHSGA